MLFVTWVEAPFRPTRDLDLLGYGDNSPEAIGDTFRAILTQPVDDDGVAFDIAGLEAAPIREDLEYGGVRVRTQAMIAGARIPIQVDVGFGDAITPGPIEIDYPALLDAPAPHLQAYPIETVVAEKFHALAVRGITNSRLKDYYDLWLIADTFELERVPWPPPWDPDYGEATRQRELIAPTPRDRRATALTATSSHRPQFSQGHVGATAAEIDRPPRPKPELRDLRGPARRTPKRGLPGAAKPVGSGA
jgi:Nucleotidyl transferase AbiEii toxin, Type IV TA system